MDEPHGGMMLLEQWWFETQIQWMVEPHLDRQQEGAILMNSDKKPVTITTTQAELIILNNSLNEVLSEIEDWEFDTRIGYSKKEAKFLMKKIKKLLDE